MKKKYKKILKITVIVLVLFTGVLAAFPIIFKGKIINLIKQNLNESLNATVDFKNADLSLLNNFPDATVRLDETSVINKAPFAGDTLFAARKIELTMGIGELFKGASEPIRIKSFSVDHANVNIVFNEKGEANYDISKGTGNETTAQQESSGFEFSVDAYQLLNSSFYYFDRATLIAFKMDSINHSGEGDLSLADSKLTTKTDALVSFSMDSVNYLNKNTVKLDAVIGINLNESTYRFLKNEAVINQLPLVFDGFVKLNEDNQEVRISFKTPSSDFKNFLALIPEAYSKNIEDVKTSGNFEVNGLIEGIVDDAHIPKLNISLVSDDASFKYPDLPKSVENIKIKTFVINKTGLVKDTYIDLERLSFRIDNDVFNGNAKFSNLIDNPYISAHVDGRINLANLTRAYPVSSTVPLSGILDADITTAFDMQTIERGHYEKTRNTGNLVLTGFKYESEELANPFFIDKADLTFNPKTVTLNTLNAKTGKTDINANGTITNLLGYVFNDEDVKGRFNMSSGTFAVNDFMVQEEQTENEGNTDKKPETGEATIKIPSFLDCTIQADAATVLYDNITLKDVSGTLIIADEKATLVNLSSSVFDGGLALNGSVSTKTDTPVFDMNLSVNAFNIASSFKQLDLFNSLAPIADVIQGKLNANLSLSGNLNNDFTPNMGSLTGNALAEFLSSTLKPESSQLLSLMTSKLEFLDLSKVNLEKLKTSVSFENGQVKVKPFSLMYEDIEITTEGSHGFNKSLDYGLTFNVPAKYMGKDAERLIAELNENPDEVKVPVTAKVNGSFTNPQVSTDLKQAVTNLTKQLAARQKDKFVGKGKDALKGTLGDLLGQEKSTDSVVKDSALKKDAVKDAAGTLIKGLFGNKNKKKDSVSN